VLIYLHKMTIILLTLCSFFVCHVASVIQNHSHNTSYVSVITFHIPLLLLLII